MTLEVPDVDSAAMETLLLSLADDEFVMGHRLAYWVARGPTIEADNEVSAIVQEELGHARLWYELVAGDGETLEDLAIGRPAAERRNSVLVEPAAGDFGETVVRQFLYDRAEKRLLASLRGGTHDVLSARAGVALQEEAFHREHADVWLDRLSGTEKGRERLAAGFASCLPRCRDLFAFDDGVRAALSESGVLERPFGALHTAWIGEVVVSLEEPPLDVPLRDSPTGVDAAGVPDVLEGRPEPNGRAGEHTDHLVELVESEFTEF